MAARVGAPAFMLHTPRKLLAAAGERLGVSDAALRRILNHTPQKRGVVRRLDVQFCVEVVRLSRAHIQGDLERLLGQLRRRCHIRCRAALEAG